MKLKLSWLTLLLIGLAYFGHFLKPLAYVFLIMSLHELSHILAASIFKVKVVQVTLYPFGLGAVMEDFEFVSVYRQLVILSAGLFSHLWIPLFLTFLFHAGWISNPFLDWLLDINRAVFLFNALPLYPLDGGRIVMCIWHLFLPFKSAEKGTLFVSFFTLLLFAKDRLVQGWMTIFVIVFLLYQLIMHAKDLPYFHIRFLLYRLVHPSTAKPKLHARQDLYQERNNFIIQDHQILPEQEWISMKLLDSNIGKKRKNQAFMM